VRFEILMMTKIYIVIVRIMTLGRCLMFCMGSRVCTVWFVCHSIYYSIYPNATWVICDNCSAPGSCGTTGATKCSAWVGMGKLFWLKHWG